MDKGFSSDAAGFNYAALLRTIPFFAGLADQELAFFAKHARRVEYKKKQSIFRYGEPAEQFFIMLEGWVKLYRENKDGEETVIGLVTRGDTFSEVATFDGSDYPYNAEVVGGTTVCLVIQAHQIRHSVRESPNLALKMLASLSQRSNQLSLVYEHITRLTAAQRVGSFLIKLSMDRDYAANILLPYNKYLVASRLGMKPETFSRAMKRLYQDLKVTLKGRAVSIPDIDVLQRYCEIECLEAKPCSFQKRLKCMNPQCDIYRMLKMM